MTLQEYMYDGSLYKIIADRGLGFRKKAHLALNKTKNELVMIFFPDITEKYNDINENKKKFLEDIDKLNELYNIHGDKCKIRPLYTSKEEYVIITNNLEGRTLYRYLTDM
jgi:hypothetical protein